MEPLSNYFIGRIQKDFNKGKTIVGGLYTNTLRDLEGTMHDEYHKMAQTAGIDITQFFKDKNWMISLNTAFSNVQGTASAIASTQESSVHYFQRPGVSHLNYNINRKQLSGNGGSLSAGKIGGKWNFMFFGLWKSPGLELNDVGYLRRADQLMGILWGAYHINEPFGIFKEMHFNSDYYSVHDFGGNYISSGYELSAFTKFKNYWSSGFHANINTNGNDNTMLRGGPSIKVPGEFRLHYSLETDSRKKLSAELEAGWMNGFYNSQSFSVFSLSLNFRPLNTLQIELEPEYIQEKNELQFIDNPESGNTTHYVFGGIQQDVFRLSARINYSITPDFTIQFWGQPFAASGKFSRYKSITNPNADKYGNRFEIFQPNQISYNQSADVFAIDENIDGIHDYSFENPNFNEDEFLSNLVIRWEFVPGSTVYLVWSQKRDYSSNLGKFSFSDEMKHLFDGDKPYNVFLLKFSYRIGLR
ncbi:MAG: hypothetical protein HC905_18190 [Bacteroidales bacterium]|nr:hypothetical protein [Bacteroidales bacterium]